MIDIITLEPALDAYSLLVSLALEWMRRSLVKRILPETSKERSKAFAAADVAALILDFATRSNPSTRASSHHCFTLLESIFSNSANRHPLRMQ